LHPWAYKMQPLPHALLFQASQYLGEETALQPPTQRVSVVPASSQHNGMKGAGRQLRSLLLLSKARRLLCQQSCGEPHATASVQSAFPGRMASNVPNWNHILDSWHPNQLQLKLSTYWLVKKRNLYRNPVGLLPWGPSSAGSSVHAELYYQVETNHLLRARLAAQRRGSRFLQTFGVRRVHVLHQKTPTVGKISPRHGCRCCVLPLG